jgi:hypothetical protein
MTSPNVNHTAMNANNRPAYNAPANNHPAYNNNAPANNHPAYNNNAAYKAPVNNEPHNAAPPQQHQGGQPHNEPHPNGGGEHERR